MPPPDPLDPPPAPASEEPQFASSEASRHWDCPSQTAALLTKARPSLQMKSSGPAPLQRATQSRYEPAGVEAESWLQSALAPHSTAHGWLELQAPGMTR
jgi:hypothetical protein